MQISQIHWKKKIDTNSIYGIIIVLPSPHFIEQNKKKLNCVLWLPYKPLLYPKSTLGVRLLRLDIDIPLA